MNRDTKNNNRGQIEVFGLAIIVILISIGFFIFISIRSQEPKSNPQKEFTNDKLANDFVLAILKTNIRECPQYNVENLIIDCARDNRIKCGIDDSCIALNRSVTYMLNKTFMIRNSKFRFYSENLKYYPKSTSGSTTPYELFNITHKGCTASSSQGQRGVSIISLYPVSKSVYLNMNICS